MVRRPIHVLALVVLLVLAGCSGIGSVTTEEGLASDPPRPYDWNSSANGSITIEDDHYRVVYRIENRDELRLYQRTGYGDDRPIDVRAIRFRYENGTVVNDSAMEVEESRSAVVVRFPAEDGQFAYTGRVQMRRFVTRTYVDGSYEVRLPPGFRVENLVLGTVRPGGYETTLEGDQLELRWEEIGAESIVVRYYRERDVYLLGGLVVVASTGGVIAMAYVYRQIRRLRRRREEMGLDVETTDDDRRRPPPGMR